MSNLKPLVSILLPAYNPQFFEFTLKSALEQDYPQLEIIICDDSEGGDIAKICGRLADNRVSYFKNPKNLGFFANFTQCFRKGSGEYLKFLNDDDFLLPSCVRQMVSEFDTHGDGLTLVTSKRTVINERGEACRDIAATIPLAHVTSYMDGRALGDFVLKHSINFIGEPTTVMFRKRDVEIEDGSLFKLNGIEYLNFADVSLWLRLLSKGDAVYIAEPLSLFRIHSGQEQHKPVAQIAGITDRYHIVVAAEKLGFLQDQKLYSQAMRGVAAIFQSNLNNSNFDADARKEIDELWRKIPEKFHPQPS